jgi:hypothetical protein
MELVMPTAIGAQLGTLPDAEHSVMLARLQLLASDPQRLGSDVKASASDPGLWTVRLSGRMLALVRAEGDQLKVLAIAPRDQLAPYLKPKGQRAA